MKKDYSANRLPFRHFRNVLAIEWYRPITERRLSSRCRRSRCRSVVVVRMWLKVKWSISLRVCGYFGKQSPHPAGRSSSSTHHDFRIEHRFGRVFLPSFVCRTDCAACRWWCGTNAQYSFEIVESQTNRSLQTSCLFVRLFEPIVIDYVERFRSIVCIKENLEHCIFRIHVNSYCSNMNLFYCFTLGYTISLRFYCEIVWSWYNYMLIFKSYLR